MKAVSKEKENEEVVVCKVTKTEFAQIAFAMDQMAAQGNMTIAGPNGENLGKCGVIYGNLTTKLDAQYNEQYPIKKTMATRVKEKAREQNLKNAAAKKVSAKKKK